MVAPSNYSNLLGQPTLCGLCLLFLTILLNLGCSRSVVGGYIDSPDKQYRVYGRVYGIYGRTLLDSPSKTVRISIVKAVGNETLLHKDEYSVSGFDVGWDTIWSEHGKLIVVIYDYGPGVEFHGLTKNEPQRKNIRTVIYRFDTNSDSFTKESSE